MIHPSFWVLVALFVSVTAYFKGRAMSERADYLLSLPNLTKKEKIEGLCLRADSMILALVASIAALCSIPAMLYASGVLK